MRSIRDIKKIVDASMEIPMDTIKFIELEILFRLAERIGITNEVNKLYTLVSRGDVVYEKYFTNDNYLLANAKIILKTMSHSKVYHDAIKEYSLECNQKNALYMIESNYIKRTMPIPELYADRINDYDNLLNQGETLKYANKKTANYKDVYSAKINSEKDAHIKFEKLNVKTGNVANKIRKGGSIKVLMEDIMQSADILDEIEGTNYRRKTIEGNLYETGNGEKVTVTDFKIHGVVNMAGQVAAGKSTFADALSATLMRKGYRVVMILSTIDAVIKKAELIQKLGYKVCTVIGNYGKSRHIDGQMRGKDYLSEYSSQILQQPCMVNALVGETGDVFKYGQEPCTDLRRLLDVNDKIKYVCPYYDFCPRTENDRNIKNADIVITTLEGFCYCNFGKNRENFMEYAIGNFDLVIMDEIDSIVCSLDNIFSPMLAVNEYLTKNNYFRFNFKGSNFQNKIGSEMDEIEFIFKLDKLEKLMISISSEVNDYYTGWSKTDLKSFSAMSLLNKLDPDVKKTGTIPKMIWDGFYRLLKPQSLIHGDVREIELLNMVEADNISNSYIMDKMSEIIAAKECIEIQVVRKVFEELDVKIIKKLKFILKVIAFEQVYRDLSRLVESMQDIPMELREILNRSLRTQQKIMPNAPVGNTLAIEVKESEMYIKKQFALGRALALRMPYLMLDFEGNPLGANVLLMSGTGYMPGSDRYHIGDRVDYVIEAEQTKRDYIAKTKVVNLKSSTWVSGVAPEDKNKNLKTLIEENEIKILKCIKKEEKILMIVNSYEQCKVAHNAIEKILRKNNSEYEAWFLKSDSGELEGHNLGNGLQRRDITSFKDGILIAPACVIERGYNIVDISGNAWFDTVMFLVRPMVDPSDYNVHVQKVNGYVMNHFSELTYENRIAVIEQMRNEAFMRYAKLSGTKGGLSDLPEEMKIDVVASLFVVIEQVFGRLCRLGSELKEKYPTIYWVDGAFNASEDGKFDTLKELEKYLDNLMHKGANPLVAKTLYEPFYKALKGEK